MLKLALATLALASFAEQVIAEPSVFSMKFGRIQTRGSSLEKRDPFSVPVGNAFQVGLYYVNASVGNPAQVVQLQIDTGSSDVWMFGPGACSDNSSCGGGTYDPKKSKSSNVIAQDAFEIQYVTPGSDVKGDYVSDDFAIGGTTIKNLTLAVATQAQSVTTGIMGSKCTHHISCENIHTAQLISPLENRL